MENNQENSFDLLPRYMKEKIWEDLDRKELFRLRIVSKNWKELIENPISSELKEDYLKCKLKSEEYQKGKVFFKDFNFTSQILALQANHGEFTKILIFFF